MKSKLPIPEHPYVFGSFHNWLCLLIDNRGIDVRYIPRALFVLLSTAASSPLRIYERLRYAPALQQVEIHPSPVFVVGHWRSGTTHLHNLICQDKNFGFVSTFQGMAPDFCLSGERFLKRPLERIAQWLHPTRLIDNVPLAFDAPQEEDYAIANLSPYSFLHQFTFPRRAAYYFDRYALFQNIPLSEITDWRRIYLDVLRKATLRSGGKRLALKNPANCGRIPEILNLFPEAKFIHITRDPYRVYVSSLHAYHTILLKGQVQRVSAERIGAHILSSYAMLMKKFLQDRALIPLENRIEIRFEDLEQAPLEQLQAIYTHLGLPGFHQAVQGWRAYLESIAGYRKNTLELSADAVAKVNQHWKFAFEAWNYPEYRER